MRLFIAIPLPDEVKQELVRLQDRIKCVGSKIKYVREFHLTLKFLGEVGDSNKIIEALKNIKFNKFKLTLDDLGVFPNMDNPRVLWVGTQHQEEVNKLHEIIDKSLDFPFDHRFHSHITLGRIKFVHNKRNFKDILANQKVKNISFEVNSFNLYKSTLTREGAVHEVIEEFSLEA